MKSDKPIKTIKDLRVYNLTFKLAMEIFMLSKRFPKEEQYSLTDQIRRSSRSIPANIREGFAKRKFEKVFIRHLHDAIGSCEETRTWLDFGLECGYIEAEDNERLNCAYDEVTAMLYALQSRWKTY